MKKDSKRRLILVTACSVIAGLVIIVFLTTGSISFDASDAKTYVRQNHISDTAAGNAVTSVYLNYRYWDTLFESLILFVSVLAVISFAWESNKRNKEMDINNSPVISITAKMLMPFIIIFGMYVIISGAESVGGGFQGGALLASSFIVRWMIMPNEGFKVDYMKVAERILLLALLLTGMLLAGWSMAMPLAVGRIWMVSINILIGIKVACGLVIIFYRFVFFESR